MAKTFSLIVKSASDSVNFNQIQVMNAIDSALGTLSWDCEITVNHQLRGETLAKVACSDDYATAVQNALCQWLAADPFEGPFKAGSLLWFGMNGPDCETSSFEVDQ